MRFVDWNSNASPHIFMVNLLYSISFMREILGVGVSHCWSCFKNALWLDVSDSELF